MGAMPPHAGQELSYRLIHPPVGAMHPQADQRLYGVHPPLPPGPPPAKLYSVANAVATRRTFASARTRTVVDQFSRSLTPEMGSALLMTVDTASKSESALNVDDNVPASVVDDTVENNLSAYLQAACSGVERPMGSHPMRLAKVLVSGALGDIEREYEKC